METVRTILELLLGSSTLLGFILYGKANRRIKDAEADSKQWERYEKQLDHAAKTIELLHSQIEADGRRISDLNGALDKKEEEITEKTVRIRSLTDRALLAEGQLNNANLKIAKLTEERDTERLMKEKYKEWHCRSSICTEGKPDPRGRRPPNPRILGKTFQSYNAAPGCDDDATTAQ